jgi:hypothetical protein
MLVLGARVRSAQREALGSSVTDNRRLLKRVHLSHIRSFNRLLLGALVIVGGFKRAGRSF